MRHVRQARQFLEGNELSPFARLQAEMNMAADKMQFERAALLRDKLSPLLWLRERLDWLDQARLTHSFIYPVAGSDGVTLWYLLRRGRVVQSLVAPADDTSLRSTAVTIEQVYDRRAAADLPAIDQVDHVLLVLRCVPPNSPASVRLCSHRNKPCNNAGTDYQSEPGSLLPARVMAACQDRVLAVFFTLRMLPSAMRTNTTSRDRSPNAGKGPFGT